MRAPYASLDELNAGIENVVAVRGDEVEVVDAGAMRAGVIDSLIYTAVFGPEDLRPVAIWLIRSTATKLGAFPASIHELYLAGGRGEYANATAPAINVRG